MDEFTKSTQAFKAETRNDTSQLAFKQFIIDTTDQTDGTHFIAYQTIYKFPNNFGASVIHGLYSYGLELAVLQFSDDAYSITYNTPITSDVIGYLDEPELVNLLTDIQQLTKEAEA
ncbi:hypothetical protein JK159_07635 [Weissella minor]|uniref:hypothetical protein n=1 Tax=Weissella minor TaxID=1620 RepID=UPI001BAF9A52|nr:hypothetical protein [Weissella minor]MBS0950232.1 hypothetical protein [Weissella minor]